ncbi:hypothetical protein NQ314_016439 [Rhamnusium bicolor]|uniref:PiggyBac transposable element-derived protein domain-containing protein n=1 Tax=Rhamnusium bicolor TaxID=1586634 RepID=A0AAV8WW74_9CUCU|nr:hypothetical protein NQ314_016439 [Rhamnusium bicolor]
MHEIEAIKKFSYNLFFDNLFTTVNLLVYLTENGYTASGTMRKNRVPKECPLLTKKDFAKTGKKEDHFSIIERTNGIIFTK